MNQASKWLQITCSANRASSNVENYTRYMHVHDVPHAEHVGSCCVSPYYDDMLFSAYPVHGPSASKVNHFVVVLSSFIN